MSLPESVVTPVFSLGNPFKGLAYYEKDDAPRFAGRQREVEAVANGILRTRTFVVYGRSGLGKTSLLLAGVLPRLAEQGCRTVYVRVLENPLADLHQALLKLSGPEAEEVGDLASANLRTLLEWAGAAKDQERPVVLVFDQFEEFFVRFADQPDPAGGVRRGEEQDREVRQKRIAQREAFVEEVGRLASDVTLNLRLLFSLREDWIAEMRDFAPVIPDITRHMVRLLPLTSFGVRQAIVETLRSAGTAFDHSLISALVDTLAEVQFDPAVLQVLGSEVWEKARARCQEGDPVRLELVDFQAVRGVRDIFRSYLDQVHRQIEAANLRQKIQTRAVLVAMISEKRTKLAVSRDFLLQQQDFDVTYDELNDVLAILVKHRLVRPDPNGGWFELVHERLIAEILDWLDTDLDYFKFRSARNLVANSCRNPGWRDNPELLLNRGQLDDAVGPFKELLRFSEEERFFLVSSAIYAHSRDLEYWAELAGFEASTDLIDRFLGQQDHEGLRRRAAEAAARVKERSGHFAERCLDLALHDPSEPVRQAAARSFANLATGPEIENLSSRLSEKESRKAALEVLTDVVDQGKVAPGVKIGRRHLWKARRKLYKRRFEEARPIVQQRSLQGGLVGLRAALLWSLTAGPLLLRIIFYEIRPDVGVVESWVWPVSVGVYLLLALPLGMGVGWWGARQLAKQALRRGREGLTFRALTEISTLFGAVLLVSTIGVELIQNDRLFYVGRYLERFGASEVFTSALWIGLWVVIGLWAVIGGTLALASPALWPDRSRSVWIWSWFWAFGGALWCSVLFWLLIDLVPASLFLYILELRRNLSFGTILGAVALLEGLLLYAGLLSIRLSGGFSPGVRLGSLQRQRPLWLQKTSRILSTGLAATSVALLAVAFGVDGLPFCATPVILDGKDFEIRPSQSVWPWETDHFDVSVPSDRSQAFKTDLPVPRLARISSVFPSEVYASGVKLGKGSVLVMEPGEALRVALQRKERGRGAIRIQTDRPLAAPWSAEEGSRFVVARLSAKGNAWTTSLSDLRSPGKQPLFVAVGTTLQGGAWCEGDRGFELQLRGGGLDTWYTPELGCSSRPRSVVFAHAMEFRPMPGLNPDLTLRAWKPSILEFVAEFADDGSFNPDGTTLTVLSPFSTAPSVASWSMSHLQGAPEGRVTLQHPKPVKVIDFSPGRAWLVTIAEDAVTRLWRVDGTHIDGSRSVPLPGAVHLFSEDATHLATYKDGSIRVWKIQRAADPKLVGELSGVGELRSWFFNSDGSQLLIVGEDGILRLWNIEAKTKPLLLNCPTEALEEKRNWDAGAKFTPDGGRVEMAHQDGTICSWQVDNSGHLLRTLRREILPYKVLSHMSVAPTKASLTMMFNNNPATLVWFSPDGSHVLTVTDGLAQIWRADGSGEPVILEDRISAANFSADGTRLVTRSTLDGGIRIWETDGFNPPAILDHAPEFTTNGTRVGTISGKVVRIWDIDRPQEPIVLVHKEEVQKVKFSRDGKRALTILATGGIRVWNLTQPYRPKKAGDLFLFLRVSRKADTEGKAAEN